MPEALPPYGGDEVTIRITDPALRRAIQSWSRHHGDAEKIVFEAASDREKADLSEKLRDQGVAFSRGPGWSPSDVFEYLRAAGLVAGSFREIYWQSPALWRIRENG